MNQLLAAHAENISALQVRTTEMIDSFAARTLDPQEAGEIKGSLLQALLIVCVHLTAADGPINQSEATILNILFRKREPISYYNGILEKLSVKPRLVDTALTNIKFHMRLTLLAYMSERASYIGEEDLIISLLQHAMDTINAADSDVSAAELRAVGAMISALREHARDLEIEGNGILASTKVMASDDRNMAEASNTDAQPQDPNAALHGLVGLGEVKIEVETLSNLARVFALRKDKGLAVPDMSFHLVFTGNPGTRKTTVARIVGQLYGKLGLLSRGHVVEVDRSGLVADFVGQTATKTRAVIDSALGGVLFIDEAYALSSGGAQDYGREAIEVILKAMEDHRDDLVVIAAGYTNEMTQFLASNPGLRSRFGKSIMFSDYNASDMVEIFRRMAAANQYSVDQDATDRLNEIMQRRLDKRDDTFANARDVRAIFESAISAQAGRIAGMASVPDDELSALKSVDLPSV